MNNYNNRYYGRDLELMREPPWWNERDEDECHEPDFVWGEWERDERDEE